jgi:hypothetical protein
MIITSIVALIRMEKYESYQEVKLVSVCGLLINE